MKEECISYVVHMVLENHIFLKEVLKDYNMLNYRSDHLKSKSLFLTFIKTSHKACIY